MAPPSPAAFPVYTITTVSALLFAVVAVATADTSAAAAWCSALGENDTDCNSASALDLATRDDDGVQSGGGAYEPSPLERSLLEAILEAAPPFAPGLLPLRPSAPHDGNASALSAYSAQYEPDPQVSLECQRQSQVFVDALRRFDLWALHMHDATAKVSAGVLLSGNVLLYGDFDACLRFGRQPPLVEPSYCLAQLQLSLAEREGGPSPRLAAALARHRSYDMLTSSPDDPGHRIPRLSAAQWGACVPSGCSSADVATALRRRLRPIAAAAGLRLRVRVAPSMCQGPAASQWAIPPADFLAGAFIFGSLLLATAIATVRDLRRDSKENVVLSRGEQYLDALSLRRSWRSLTAVSERRGEVAAADGVRALNAILLLGSHKAMALFYHAFHDRTRMAEHTAEIWTVIARAASLYTDPFILLSGALSTHALLRHLDRSAGRMPWRREYVSRYLRLAPSLGAVILWCTLVLPWLGSGPQWPLLVAHHATLCKASWWRNMLFIHNYFGFENMCLTHTHHVGIDAQLFFVLAPPLALLLWKRPRAGVGLAAALAAASTAHRYAVTRQRQLTNFVTWGVSVSKLFESANYSYILPSHRAGVYLLGVLLGHALYRMPRDLKIKESVVAAGWAAAAALAWASFLRPATMGSPSYVYDADDAAKYSAFAPLGFCLAFAWIILLAHIGRAGAIGRLLCWRGFQVTTRLSYALYLTQFPVFFYNVGSARAPQTYSLLLLFNLLEIGSIMLASLALTIFVDLPAQRMRQIFLQDKKTTATTTQTTPAVTTPPAETTVAQVAG